MKKDDTIASVLDHNSPKDIVIEDANNDNNNDDIVKTDEMG